MNCKNCNSQLSTSINYCAHCGNKIINNRLTVKRIIKDFNNQFFNYDNKIFKTFIHLLTKPEVVINKFIDGSRKTYFNVISYLALSLTLIGFQLLVLQKFYPETMQQSSTPGLDPEVEKKIVEAMSSFFDYFGLITILFIPILALATYIVFNKKKHNYAEHIVVNMYANAQYNIMMFFLTVALLITGLDPMITMSVVTLIIYIYLGYCFKRLYSLSVFETIWRTFVSQLLYMIFVGVIFIALAVIGVIIYKLAT